MCVVDIFRRGIAAGGVTVLVSLSGPPAGAQPLPEDAATIRSPAATRLRSTPTRAGKAPGRLPARGDPDGREERSPYFDRWGIEVSVGYEAPGGLPGAVSFEGLFLSAGLYLSDSLALVAETGTTGRASGRLTTPGQAPQKFVDAARSWPSKPAACPEMDAGFGTYLGGVKYRRRFRGGTVFAHGLAGRAEYSGTATEIGESGVRTNCYEAFGTGRAVAAGGGIDVHLNDRIAIRVMADYRRLAVPSLAGMETVFMARDAARLDMVRGAVGFVFGL